MPTFLADLLAGVSVGILLIPQSLAYAVLAGLPPVYGLYSSTLPLFIYAALASSTKLQLGPVAPTSILINSALNSVVSNTVTTDPSTGEEVASTEYIETAIAMCFIVGMVQLLLGFLRFGFIANLLSWPVMSGYTSAAGLIIIASQLKDLLGLDAPAASGFIPRIIAAASSLGTAHWQTVLLGTICLIVLLGYKYVTLPGGRKIPAWFPTQLLVVVICLALSAGLDWQSTGMTVVGEIPATLPTPTFPIKSLDQFLRLLPGSLVLAVVAYVGSISLAVIFGKDAGEEVNADLELVASGAACLGGSFFSSFVVSGSFTRTAVNADLGSRTPMAVVFTGALMVACLLLLAPLFTALPNCVLAGMIMASTKSLLKISDARKLWASSTPDALQMLATFLLTLGLGIDNGIIAAVALSLLLLLYRSFQPRVAELGRFPGTDVFMDLDRFPDALKVQGVAVLRVDGELHFGNVKLLTTRLAAMHAQALKVRKAAGLPPHGLDLPPPDVEGERKEEEDGVSKVVEAVQVDVEMGAMPLVEEEGEGVVRRRGGTPAPTLAAQDEEEDKKGAPTPAPPSAATSTGVDDMVVFGNPFAGYAPPDAVAAVDGPGAPPATAVSPPLHSAPSRRALMRALSAYDRTLEEEAAGVTPAAAASGAAATTAALVARHSTAVDEAATTGAWEAPLRSALAGGELGDLDWEAAVELVHLRGVVLDACRILNMDAHAARELNALVAAFAKAGSGVRLTLAAVPGPVRDKLSSLGLLDTIGTGHVHQTVGAAVSALVGHAEYAAWTASLASFGQLLDVLLPHHKVRVQGEGEGDLTLAEDAEGAAAGVTGELSPAARAALASGAVAELG